MNNQRRPSLAKNIFIGAMACFVLASCGVESVIDSPLTIWTASSVDKTMREETPSDTSHKTLNIKMAKNEYEGAQLLMRSKEDIGAYNVVASDLTSGGNVISKDDISLYNVKYISSIGISSSINTPALPVGSSMPDALLPFETAVEYGENVLPKNVNQSVYVEVKTSKGTPSGVYSGVVTVYTKNLKHEVPLKVTVIDYLIPDESSTSNYFAQWGTEHFNSAELDGTDTMAEAYYETMLNNRMSSSLPFEGIGGPTRYVELLRKYYHHQGFSAYKFFYEATYSSFEGSLIPFNVPLFKEYLYAVAKASLEDRTDYLSKAFLYFSTFVDEPDTNPNVTWDMVKQISEIVHGVLLSAADEMAVSLASEKNYDFYETNVKNSIVNMSNIIPGSYSIATLESHGAGDITACTSVDKFDSAESRLTYERSSFKTWWYTCISPKYPYPNFLANNFLMAPRLISWMQRAYYIDGFLLWDTNNYTSGDNNSTPYLDCYSSLTDTMSYVSDGKIFYPGAPYGIVGPVSSLRVVSYRDGMEDQELLKGIYDKYSEYGLDAGSTLESIYDQVFSGVITTTSVSSFDKARDEMISLLVALESPTAIIYSSIESDPADSNITHYAFLTPNADASVSIGGEDKTKGSDGYYHFDIDATKQSEVSIKVNVGPLSTTYTRTSTSKYTKGNDFESGAPAYIAPDNFASMAISTEYHKSGSSSLAITLNGKDKVGYKPSFAIKSSAFTATNDLTSIEVAIYIPFDTYDDFKTSVNASYGTDVLYNVSLGSVYLQKGWNNVKLSIQDSVSKLDNIQEFRFYFPNIVSEGKTGSETIYLDDFGYRTKIASSSAEKEELGAVTISESTASVSSGTKQNLVIANDVSNVTETINGEKYLLLGDFENYNQIAQPKYSNHFGKISVNANSDYLTHGKGSLRLEIVGRGETLKHLDPIMNVYTSSYYFQKQNYSDVDYLEVDFYNAMNYIVPVRFSDTDAYFSKFSTIMKYDLNPGLNHLKISLETLKANDGDSFSSFSFIFQRGENFDENRIVYMDNFRAHLMAQ